MKKLLLIALLALPLGCQPPADAPPADSGDSNSTAAASDETTTQMVMAVDGMSCSIACPPEVEKALVAVPGVKDVTVDFETKQATMTVIEDTFDRTAAVEALSTAGFEGQLN